MNDDDDEPQGPDQDPPEEEDQCPHEPDCKEGKGHLHFNWRRLRGDPVGQGGPWVWRSIPIVGEQCDCEHDEDCPFAEDDEAWTLARVVGLVMGRRP